MTRKDFKVIAGAMARVKPPPSAHMLELNGWRAAVMELAFALRCTNPRFDRQRFMAACGLANEP